MNSERQVNIEVGCGFAPFVNFLRNDLKQPNSNSLLIDVNLKPLSNLIRKGYYSEFQGYLATASGIDLPVKDNSVDVIFLKDAIFYLNMWQFKLELKRVGKGDSTFILLETQDYVSWRSLDEHFSDKNMFRLREAYFGNEVNRILQPGRNIFFPEESFALVFNKK